MVKFISLEGNVYSDWTVIEYAGEGKWLCRCSCGTEREVMGKTLRSGASKSCGHNSNILKDLKGQRFNSWEVLEYVSDSRWLCKCDCGNTSIVGSYDLRSNKSKDCGHMRVKSVTDRNKENRIKLEGKQYNDWSVLRYLGDKQYECKCSCGKIKSVSASCIVSGSSKSCGHNNGNHSIKSLIGKVFGELEVIEYIGNKQWKCQCSCGNYTVVNGGNLKNDSVRSCGCKQYNRLTKEEFMEVINKYILDNGEKPFIADLSTLLDRHQGNISRYIKEYNLKEFINSKYGSKYEREIYSIFDGGILHDREVLSGRELDIYYPKERLAIEFNGDYWHSTVYKDKMYHQRKTIDCAKKGIQLIHIFEYEWKDSVKREKIIKLINKKLNAENEIVYGRNTKIDIVGKNEAKEFLNKYHLQGYTTSSINLGCYHGNSLLGIMTFGKPRFNNNYQYELIRLAWKDNMAVIGGTDKLFKHFLKEYNPESIITYCDISKFTGNVYTRLGFMPVDKCLTDPNYVWVNTIDNIVLNRYQTMKGKLLKEGLGEIEQTEDDIMESMGYVKIYDCGNLRLLYNNI